MCQAFEQLIAMPEYGGGYNSLTPGHPNFVSVRDEKCSYEPVHACNVRCYNHDCC